MEILAVVILIIGGIGVLCLNTRSFLGQLAKLDKAVCPKCKAIGALEPMVPTADIESIFLPEEFRKMACYSCNALIPFDEVIYLSDETSGQFPTLA